MRPKRMLLPALVLTATALVATGCAQTRLQKVGPGEAVTVLGPPVRTNRTPLEPALAYLAKEIYAANQPKLTIAVGDVKDYTGKYNINEGNAITQGGSLMVYSALGKLGGAVRIADRYDTNVAQMELSFINQRELGDGQTHDLGEGKAAKKVPWLPYYGGSITQSDYYITGGITELNYNVQSGGVSIGVDMINPQAEVYTENVGIDLQIVNTKTLMVEKTVSLEKQITGFQVGFNIFRFFGSDLYDVNTGNKSQEPLQLGVRSTLEEAVLVLVAAVEHVPEVPALEQMRDGYWIPPKTAQEFLNEYQAAPAVAEAPPAAAPMTPAPTTPVAAATLPPAAEAPPPAAAPPPVAVAPPPPEAGPPQPAAPPPPAEPVATAPPAPPPPAAKSTLNEETSPPLQNGLMGQTDGSIHVAFDFGGADVTGADVSEIDRAAQLARSQPVQIMLTARANENWAPSKRQALTAQRIDAVRRALQLRGILQITIAWVPAPTATGIKMDGSGSQEVAMLVVSP
jgi:curli biogenesis system outer membrane secretion channel CsgG/outer membrane protein OmpA-like peptidoglycan-associated protein